MPWFRPRLANWPRTGLTAWRGWNRPLLERYTADGATEALAWLIGRWQPDFVLLPHSYQGRDLGPKLAARLGVPLLSDVTAIQSHDGELTFTRQLYQGKLNADYAVPAARPAMVSIQGRGV